MAQFESPYLKIKPKIKSPYTLIYLIRHCHPDYSLREKLGDQDMPLSVVGKEQRVCLNKKLLSLDLDRIYSSQLVRARQTAEAYATIAKKQIIVEPRLNEIEWIDWYKMRYFNMSDKTRIKRIKGYEEMEKRLNKYQTEARRLLADIYNKNKGKEIALFCHGNLIKSILTGILNTDVVGFLSLEIYLSSISKIVVDKEGYVKINYINDIDHLPHKPDEDLFKFAMSQ